MTFLTPAIADTAEQIGNWLKQQHCTLVTAESCTGGLLSAQLTELSGSSTWLEGAFVTYRLSAKQHMLGISEQTLSTYGAVSRTTALQMAAAALQRCSADFAVAITGIAGPTGATSTAPTGTVWIAWRSRSHTFDDAQVYHISGDRSTVRVTAVELAMQGLLGHLTRL